MYQYILTIEIQYTNSSNKSLTTMVNKRNNAYLFYQGGKSFLESFHQNSLFTSLSRTGSYDHSYTRETRKVNGWLFHLDSKKQVRKSVQKWVLDGLKNRSDTFYVFHLLGDFIFFIYEAVLKLHLFFTASTEIII